MNASLRTWFCDISNRNRNRSVHFLEYKKQSIWGWVGARNERQGALKWWSSIERATNDRRRRHHCTLRVKLRLRIQIALDTLAPCNWMAPTNKASVWPVEIETHIFDTLLIAYYIDRIKILTTLPIAQKKGRGIFFFIEREKDETHIKYQRATQLCNCYFHIVNTQNLSPDDAFFLLAHLLSVRRSVNAFARFRQVWQKTKGFFGLD